MPDEEQAPVSEDEDTAAAATAAAKADIFAALDGSTVEEHEGDEGDAAEPADEDAEQK